MLADPDAQRRLLDLQALDTAVAQVQHKRRALPEHAEIARLQQARAKLAEEVVADRTRVWDLEAESAKAEADLVPVRERKARDQQRVDGGAISDPKALTSLLTEIEHLERRIVDLEDNQLDAMERLEAAQGALADATRRKTAVEDELRAAVARRDEKLAALGEELAQRQTERDAVARVVPADLLDLYTKVAAKSGGVGAALLQHGRCGGCHLEATAADLARYRAAAPDAVLRCEECSRILVRTGESGL